MEQLDVDASLAPELDALAGAGKGLVGGIVQHLDLEPIRRVVQTPRSIDEALHDGPLVEGRKLDRDGRPPVGWRMGGRGRCLPRFQRHRVTKFSRWAE